MNEKRMRRERERDMQKPLFLLSTVSVVMSFYMEKKERTSRMLCAKSKREFNRLQRETVREYERESEKRVTEHCCNANES